ncbi:MAG: hypothetical protein AAF683_13835 [Pseudomonadota bacterium]
MATDARVAAVFSLMASACASGPQIGDEAPRNTCGASSSGWIISEAPDNADDYRQIATESSPYETEKISADEWGHHDEETWLIKSSGEVILCIADGPPWEAWTVRFWEFAAPEEDSVQLKVVRELYTIIVG